MPIEKVTGRKLAHLEIVAICIVERVRLRGDEVAKRAETSLAVGREAERRDLQLIVLMYRKLSVSAWHKELRYMDVP